MTHSPVITDESDRLALLHTSKLLDADVDPAFDALARLVAAQLSCPMAAINLIDGHRVWSMSRVGLDLRQCSRGDAFCAVTIANQGRLIVGDTRQEPRFAGLSAPRGEKPILAYAGMPIVVEGHALGTVCAFDFQPRDWTAEEIGHLKDLTIAVTSLVETKIQGQRIRRMEARIRTASLAGSDWLWETNRRGQIEWVSPSLLQHTGVDPSTEVGLMASDIYSPRNDHTRESWERFQQAISRHEPFTEAIAERDTPRGRMVVSISGTPVFTSQGQFMGYRGASRNVTRQIDIEQQARLSDLILRQAIESFEASVMISDSQGMVVLNNSRWRTNVGDFYDERDPHWPSILRKMIHAGVYPQAVGQEEAYFQWRMGLRHSEDPHEVQFKDKWLLIKDQLLPDGGTVHFALDVTPSKRDELELADQQRAVQESEARLQAVLRALPDSWMVIDAQERYLDARDEHGLLTQPFKQLKGQSFEQGLAPEHVGKMTHALKAVRDSGLPQRLEYAQIGPTGGLRHLEVRMASMPNGSILVLARDITDREVGAEKLRVSEELYRSVAASISDGLIIVDLSGRVVAVNPAANRILGIDAHKEFAGSQNSKLGIELLQSDLQTPLALTEWPLHQTIKRGLRIIDRVHALRRHDGEILWVRVSSNLLRIGADGEPFAAMATFRDITQEQRATLALEASEARWKFALDGAGDGVWDWDPRSGDMFFSARWKAMLGYSEDEVSGGLQELAQRIHPDDRARIEVALQAYVEGGEGVFQAEFRLAHKDGHYIWILARGKIVTRDDQGRAIRVVGTHSDITPIKRAEQALREKHAAEAASQAKSQFLSRMSHEIRTPLNAVNGFAQLLKLQQEQSGITDTTQKGYVEHILRAGKHLMGVVNDVLDLQQVEAGVMLLKPEPLQLHEEIRECLAMLEPLAQARHISLRFEGAVDSCVMADRQRLRQVLMNVGSNAIKYNYNGGNVRYDVERVDQNCLSVIVSDSGPGMSAQQLGRLFQPFERLGRETSNIEGTGLGLIITRSLVEAMGGRMEIRSQPGAGTRVTLILPQSSHAPDTPVQAASTSDSSLPSSVMNIAPSETSDNPTPPRPLRVLYVEDNRINAMLFEEALRPYPQIELDVAEDGQMALSMAKEKTPDVLVLDAHLPGMSGFEVLRALRTVPGLKQAPAYMCSADAMPEDVAKAHDEGFTGYWTKPIDIVEVTNVLCTLANELLPSQTHP
ncbi:MAG TPA: PAS domain S-box protein [Aquabacterium sp.]|nr:PAS domain S-box protein [Aquabacterium sp.]